MNKPSYKELQVKIQNLQQESSRLKQIEKELLEKQRTLRNQNINLVKRSIELSDVRRELEDMNYELELTRSQLRSENVNLIKKSIALSDIMRELEDKNYYLKLSRSELETTIIALQESEHKYSKLVQESPDPMISLDNLGNFLSFNPTAEHLSGFLKEEVLGKHFTKVNILTKESKQKALKEFVLVMMGKKRPPFGLTIMRKDKSLLSMEANPRLIRHTGKKAWVQVTLRDVTGRKKAEKALQESEQRFRTLQENIPIGVYRTTVTGKILSANPAMIKLFGYGSEAEFLTKSSYKFYLVPQQRKELIERLKVESKVTGFETQMKRKDGSIFWSSLHVKAVTDEKGKILHFDGILEDIGERKHTAEVIIRAKQEWERTFDSIPELISILDEKFNILRMNRAMAERIGITLQEAIGKKCYEIVHGLKKPPDNCPHMRMLKDEQEHTWEIHEDHLGGDFLITVSPMHNMQGKLVGAVHTALDVTQRNMMEKELLKSQKLESLGFLAGGIAHDFNNILAAIMGYNSLAKLYAGEKDKALDMLNEVEKAVSLAKDLTQQLLTFSRGGAPVKQHASIGELLKDTSGFTLSGSDINCDYSIPKNLWTVEIDEGQISQVIQNLVINAKQASAKGGTIQIKVKNIQVGSKERLPLEEGRYVRIMVKDYGAGIPEDHIAKIFDPFFTTKPKGVGLGLSTAYSIIKNHNGLIMVDSESENGTTFHVYLPATENTTEKKKKERAKMVAGQGKILLMDDEEMILKSTSKLLQDIGYTVETAKDGAKTIELFRKAKQRKQPFDVVVLDLIVPGSMSGEHTIKEIMKIDAKVKAIVSSGYSTDPVIANYKKYGFAGAISKPYRFEEMSAIIRKIITGSDK